jgi:putative IMPACT (imprinted ancient) family translation regulator
LLGKGGLVRAYSNATKKVIEEAGVYEIIETKKVIIECEYNIKDKILFNLSKKDYKKEIVFGEKINIILDIPEKDVVDFTENMIKISDNKISISILS